jgi:arginase family enzyme
VVFSVVFQVSPPFDQNGATSLVAANLLFEILCVLPGVKYKETAFSPPFQI